MSLMLYSWVKPKTGVREDDFPAHSKQVGEVQNIESGIRYLKHKIEPVTLYFFMLLPESSFPTREGERWVSFMD